MAVSDATAVKAEAPRERRMARLHGATSIVLRLGFTIVMFAVAFISTPEFGTWTNLTNIVNATAILGIVAVGMTLVTLSGNFFALSSGSTAALVGLIFALLHNGGWPVGVALLVSLASGMASGLVQGAFVAFGGNPVVVTLAAGAIMFGAIAAVTDGQSEAVDAPGWILRSSTALWTLLACTVGTTLALRFTRPGRRLILTGASRPAAKASGLNTALYTMLAFVGFGLMCGLAGVLLAAQFTEVRPSNYSYLDLGAVAAVLIAGTAVGGGEGSPVQTVVAGVFFVGILENVAVLSGWSTGVQHIFIGAVVIFVVAALARLHRVSIHGRSRQ